MCLPLQDQAGFLGFLADAEKSQLYVGVVGRQIQSQAFRMPRKFNLEQILSVYCPRILLCESVLAKRAV